MSIKTRQLLKTSNSTRHATLALARAYPGSATSRIWARWAANKYRTPRGRLPRALPIGAESRGENPDKFPIKPRKNGIFSPLKTIKQGLFRYHLINHFDPHGKSGLIYLLTYYTPIGYLIPLNRKLNLFYFTT